MHSADPRARNILFGLLVKLVITSPCHGEDHGFKSRRDREVGVYADGYSKRIQGIISESASTGNRVAYLAP